MRIKMIFLLFCISCAGSLVAIENSVPFAELGNTVPDYVNKYYDETGRLLAFPDWQEDESSKNIDEENLKKLSGDAVFFRYSYMSVPGFNYCPSSSEIIGNASVSLSPSEYEPLTFGVFGMHATEVVEWNISDFRSKEGKFLDKKFVDVRILHGVPQSTVTWDEWVKRTRKKTEHIYKRVPLILEKRNPFMLPLNESRHFWITVYAPEGIVTGVYSGHMTLKGKTWKQDLPIEINILPIVLKTPNMVFNIFMQPDKRAEGFYFKENLTLHLADIKSHGVNSVACDLAPEFIYDKQRNVVDMKIRGASRDNGISPYDNLSEFMDMYKNAGFSGPLINCFRCFMGYHQYLPMRGGRSVDIFTENNIKLMTEFIRRFRALADEKRVNVGIEIGDEPANTIVETRKVTTFIPLIREKFKNLMIVTFINGMWKGINEIEKFSSTPPDVYISNYVNEELLDSAKRHSVSLWIYSNARDPLKSRYNIGFYPWSIGVNGAFTWLYQTDFSYKKDTYINFDGFNGRSFSGSMAAPSPSGPLPMPAWEAYREGVDDQRYVCTLESLIDQAKKTSSDKELLDMAHKAERVLSMIKSECRENTLAEQSSAWFNPLRFSNYRKAIVSLIIRLQEIRDHKNSASAAKPGGRFDLKVRDIRMTEKEGKISSSEKSSIYVPEILGEISEDSWQKASVIDDFRIIGTGTGASETSRIKFLFNQGHFLIRFGCNDAQPGEIVADKTREKDQEVWKDDCIELFLLKRLGSTDYRGAHFSLNAGNIPGDALIDTLKYKFEKTDWNAEWKHSANITKNGWQAEMIIPLSILGLDGKNPGELKFLAGRHLKRENEDSSFPAVANKFFEPEKMVPLVLLPAKPLVLLSDKVHGRAGESNIVVQLFNNMDREFSGSIAASGEIPSKIKIVPHSAETIAVAVKPLSVGISDIPLNIFDDGGKRILDSVIKCSAAPEVEGLSINSDILFAGDEIDIGVKNIFSGTENISCHLRILKENCIVLEKSFPFPDRAEIRLPGGPEFLEKYEIELSVLKNGSSIYKKESSIIVAAE